MESKLFQVDNEIYQLIQKELKRQQTHLELIASENFTSKAVMEAQSSILTNKYAEGYPGKRYYGGCEFVDIVEDLAKERAKEIFKADHVNVQPHSGAQANMAAYQSILNPGDVVLGMDLTHGGHLTHGSPVNASGLLYKFLHYGVCKESGYIDYELIESLAREHKPKLIVAGASAYPRIIDFERISKVAKEIGAYFLVDMAHIAGLVAAGLHPNPVEFADIVTTTTHKTLRGPRGGMILCRQELAKAIDKAVFPGSQGGPLMHVIAAKAVALKEAMEDSYKDYQLQVIKNAKTLADSLTALGFNLISGGTDNHLMLVDLQNMNITGKEAEKRLDSCGITVNKNTVPFDPQGPFVTSGIRIGTPAVTSRGMKEKEMKNIAEFIYKAVKDESTVAEVKKNVEEMCVQFPLYQE